MKMRKILLCAPFIFALATLGKAQAPSGPLPPVHKTQEKEKHADAKKSETQGPLWKLEEETSEFDGKKTQIVFQAASKKVRDGIGVEREVALDFSCEGSEIRPLLRFDGGFESSEFRQGTAWTRIRYRFQAAGEMGPIREVQWFTGRQYAAPLHFSPDFAVDLFHNDVLLIEFTPSRSATVTARFELRGLRAALSNLETCRDGVLPR